MQKTTQTQTAGGMGFLSWLTLLFIALKLMGYIDWSWWWVLSPTLIPLGIVLGFLLILGLIAGVLKILESFTRKW